MLSNGYLKRYVRCCLLIIGLCPALLYAQSSPTQRINSCVLHPANGHLLSAVIYLTMVLLVKSSPKLYQARLSSGIPVLPWARAYAETQRGLYDATAIWMHSAEREIDFSIACQ